VWPAPACDARQSYRATFHPASQPNVRAGGIAVTAVQQRSTFVTVLAWVFITLSGFGTLISILQNVMIHSLLRSPQMNPMPVPPPGAPAATVFLMAHMQLFFLAFLVMSVVMLVSSIGLLMRWNWARLCFVGLMILSIVWNVVSMAVQMSMFSSFSAQFAAMSPPQAPDMTPVLIAIGVVSVVFALGFSVLFGWIAKRLLSAPIAAEFQ
jgi:hypothetical protein